MPNNNMNKINDVNALKDRYTRGSLTPLKSEYRIKSLVIIAEKLREEALKRKDPEFLGLAVFYTKIAKKYSQWLDSIISTSMPKGIIFIVASSNIELISLYNWGISFLCGNITIARISRRVQMKRINRILNIIKDVLKNDFNDVFFQDDECNNTTRAATSICDVRILWGSNKSIEEIKKEYASSMQEDIAFASRKSMTLINANALLGSTYSEKNMLIKNLWNDTLELSFNACSSPHKICIIGKQPEREKSFQELLDRLRDKCKKESILNGFITTNNLLETQLKAITTGNYKACHELRGKLINIAPKIKEVENSVSVELIGVDTLDQMMVIMKRTQPQTLTYYGLGRKELKELVYKEDSYKPDRLEKVGNALNFDVIWDGINLFERLSKQVNYDI